MIRFADRKDTYDVRKLAEKHAVQFYPGLTFDRTKANKLIDHAILRRVENLCLVSQADTDSPITGALIAMESQLPWARKNAMHVLLWCAEVPGDGAKMLRMFKQWVRPKMTVRVAGIYMDTDFDARAGKLAERIGFAHNGCAYLWYRRQGHGTVQKD